MNRFSKENIMEFLSAMSLPILTTILLIVSVNYLHIQDLRKDRVERERREVILKNEF